MVECSFTNLKLVGLIPVTVTYISDIAPVSSKEFPDIQATIECGFTLICVHDIIRTCSQTKYDLIKLVNFITSLLKNG